MPLTVTVNTIVECLRTDCNILGDNKKMSLHVSFPHPSQSSPHSTTTNIHVFRSLSYAFLSVAGRWPFYCYSGFLPRWGNQNARRHCQKCLTFMTWKKPEHLTARNEFYGTPGQNSLNPTNQGANGIPTPKNNTEWETEILCSFFSAPTSYYGKSQIQFCARSSVCNVLGNSTCKILATCVSLQRLSVNVTKVKQITNVSLRTRSRLVAFSKTLLQLNSEQVAGLCGQHYLVHWVAKCTNRENAITMAKQIFSKCTRVRIFDKQTNRWNGMTIIHLAHCTKRSHWHVCQKCQTLESLIRKSLYL
jgi:hypothetical protein